MLDRFGWATASQYSSPMSSEGNLQADGPAELHQRIDVETEKIERGGRTAETRFAVRLNIYSRIEESDSPQASAAGDVVPNDVHFNRDA